MRAYGLKLNSLFALLLSVLVVSCGGGSGSGSNPDPDTPFDPDSPAPDDIVLVDIFPSLASFSNPVAAHQAPGDGGRWFVVEKSGRVRVFENSASVTTSSTFVDISARVDSSASESGLLGMAFHPDFDSNGEVFVSYTETGDPFVSIVSRFTSVDGGLTLDTSSEEVVLRFDQDNSNHNGGQVGFGPDGFLYIGSGDGGGGGDPLDRAEDPRNLLGAILRIDVDAASPYAIPSNNPFAGNELCQQDHSSLTNCPEIFAWGIRNPWRWSFDSQTGDLWVGDVGQGAWEEVDIVEVGGNYGWDHREGAHCYEPSTGCETVGLEDPVAEYDHSEGQSVTGGYVYRGSDISVLFGSYVFGDFVSGTIWTLSPDGTGGYDRDLLLETDLNIASFAEGEDGELLVVDYAGRLYQLQTE